MNTNRLSASLTEALNAQMTKEAHASQIYLSYAAWADSAGYAGVANFLFRHAQEERNHMMKILEYILKRGGEVKVTAIPAPPPNPSGIQQCFEKIFEQINAQLENKGLIVKTGAIVDATVTDSPRKPKGKTTYPVADDRKEEQRSQEHIKE